MKLLGPVGDGEIQTLGNGLGKFDLSIRYFAPFKWVEPRMRYVQITRILSDCDGVSVRDPYKLFGWNDQATACDAFGAL